MVVQIVKMVVQIVKIVVQIVKIVANYIVQFSLMGFYIEGGTHNVYCNVNDAFLVYSEYDLCNNTEFV